MGWWHTGIVQNSFTLWRKFVSLKSFQPTMKMQFPNPAGTRDKLNLFKFATFLLVSIGDGPGQGHWTLKYVMRTCEKLNISCFQRYVSITEKHNYIMATKAKPYSVNFHILSFRNGGSGSLKTWNILFNYFNVRVKAGKIGAILRIVNLKLLRSRSRRNLPCATYSRDEVKAVANTSRIFSLLIFSDVDTAMPI